MNIDSAFPSQYLKASDLGEAQPTVTISHAKMEPVGRDKDMKLVLYFEGKEKGMVLNKTNATKIATLVGSKDTEAWRGKAIRLYATETEFAGETVECIRVKAASGGASVSPSPAADWEPSKSDPDIPF